MTIRSKLSWGMALSALMTLGLTALGVWSLFRLAEDSRQILLDNHRSVEYARQMAGAALGLPDSAALRLLRHNLHQAQVNITEPGEKELIASLDSLNTVYAQQPTLSRRDQLIGMTLKLQQINLNALESKNLKAESTALETTQIMTIAAVLALAVVLGFAFAFPAIILSPLDEIRSAIRTVASGNYQQQIAWQRKDEYQQLADEFNRMAQALHQFERSNVAQLLAEKQRLEELVADLPDALLLFGPDSRLLLCNEKAQRLFGLSADYMGLLLSDVAAASPLLTRALEQQDERHDAPQPLVAEVASEGRSYFYQVSLRKLGKSDGGLGQLVRLQDVSRFEELDRAKSRFLATVAHQLKTPLSSMNLLLKLLADPRTGALSQQQVETAEQLQGEVTDMIRLVGELLDMARYDQQYVLLRPVPCRARELIEQATQALRPQIEDKDLRLEVRQSEELVLRADPQKTVWVLINLLGNAVRYAPRGSLLRVACERMNESTAQFKVQDEGKGVPPGYEKRVFEPFYRADSNGASGSGLGLSIAKEFIGNQGGSIGVHNDSRGGAVFWFQLPLNI